MAFFCGFNPNTTNVVNALALDASNNLYAGGYFTVVGNVTRNYLAKINADGSLSSSFNPNMNGVVYALALDASGNLYAGGAFTKYYEVFSAASLGKDTFDNANFSYYPNPTSGILNILYSKEISEVNVVNLLGQTVLNKKTNSSEVQIDLSNLANETYFVRVVSEGSTKRIKVLKGL